MNFTNLSEKLTSHGYTVHCCETGQEAKDYVLSMIEDGADIGMGGSMTVASICLPEALQERGHKIYSHAYSDLPAHDARMSANSADYYLCSTNAITADGVLVNIDGVCNRISSMAYGPGQVIYIIGRNKIAEDIPSAIKRIKEVACPQNARRLGLSLPCGITGKCNDCDSPHRMCRNTLITERAPRDSKHTIILINEDLGY